MRETSVKTFYEILNEGLLGCMQEKVFKALNRGEGTDREVTQFLGLKDPNLVRPRRKELLDMNLIEDKGVRACFVTGRKSHVWRVKKELFFRPLVKKKRVKCAFCQGKGYFLK